MIRRLCLLTLFCSIDVVAAAGAQRRVPVTPAETKVPVNIALQVGAESYSVTGDGLCHYTGQASIYDAPAEQWTVQQDDGPKSVALTMWRLKQPGSSDMLSLAVNSGRKAYTVSTVKLGDHGQVSGLGTVTLVAAGKGGTFTINATAADGTKISGTLKCEAFTAPRPVAGD